ncbi:MAG TPA: hypothetical protein VKF28_03230 [Candidatus Dormibacteraeota bacterium]|nr:hypothetical protein [Candidatus Dormibacteraeota bacterium]
MLKKSARFLGLVSLASLALVPLLSRPAAATSAQTGTLFAITQSQNLVKIDPATGFSTQQTSLFPNCSGNCPLDSQSFELTSDPTTHRLFAVRTNSFSFNFPPVFTQELLTIDSQTAQILSNPQFTINAPGALAFDTSTHTLFGFTGTEIVKVDPATATLRHFASVGAGFGAFVYQMALSSSTHTIYLSQEDLFLPQPPNPTTVFSIDTISGAVSAGVSLDTPIRWIVADGANLFGITDNFALSLVAINTTTGATTFVAGTGYFNAFIPSGPAVDPTTHTVYVDVVAFGFDHVLSINDHAGGQPKDVTSFQSLTSIAFEAPPQVTPQSIIDDVRAALASGAIDNAGVATSLLAKLNTAADARAGTAASTARLSAASGARPNGCATSANIYQAFIDEVNAQSGAASSSTRGHITPAAASQLVSEAQFLIANCP